jgi:hypothetical protein
LNLTFLSLWLQLITVDEINSELGTITEILSFVKTIIALIEIIITSPNTSPTWILSPTFIGLSKRIITPLTKLFVTFCKLKPIPIPRVPARIVIVLKLIPTVCITIIRTKYENTVTNNRNDREPNSQFYLAFGEDFIDHPFSKPCGNEEKKPGEKNKVK